MLRNLIGPIEVFAEYSTSLLVNYFYYPQIDEALSVIHFGITTSPITYKALPRSATKSRPNKIATSGDFDELSYILLGLSLKTGSLFIFTLYSLFPIS